MNKITHDPEAATLAKIYHFLIEKSEQHKREMAQKNDDLRQQVTIPGFDSSPDQNEANHHVPS